MRSFLSTADAEILVHAFIWSRLDYCNALFSCLPHESTKSHMWGHIKYISIVILSTASVWRSREPLQPRCSALYCSEQSPEKKQNKPHKTRLTLKNLYINHYQNQTVAPDGAHFIHITDVCLTSYTLLDIMKSTLIFSMLCHNTKRESFRLFRCAEIFADTHTCCWNIFFFFNFSPNKSVQHVHSR